MQVKHSALCLDLREHWVRGPVHSYLLVVPAAPGHGGSWQEAQSLLSRSPKLSYQLMVSSDVASGSFPSPSHNPRSVILKTIPLLMDFTFVSAAWAMPLSSVSVSKWGPLGWVQPSFYTPASLLHFCLYVQGPGMDFGVSLAHSTEQELKE